MVPHFWGLESFQRVNCIKVTVWSQHPLSRFPDVFLFTPLFLARVHIVKEAR